MLAAFSRLLCGIPTENWLEEMLEPIVNANQTADERKQCENHQRTQHDHGTLVRLAMSVIAVSMRCVPCP